MGKHHISLENTIFHWKITIFHGKITIFHRKISGFRFRFSQENQSIAAIAVPRRCCEVSPNGRYIAAGSDDARTLGEKAMGFDHFWVVTG